MIKDLLATLNINIRSQRMRSSLERMRSSLVRMRSSLVRMRSSLVRMRSSLVVRASDCQCTSCNGPGFDPSIRQHSGIWGAADEAVLNIVRRRNINISWWGVIKVSRLINLAGHGHRGRWRRQWHLASGILVRYRNILVIPTPDWVRHRHFCWFRYRPNQMPDSLAFKEDCTKNTPRTSKLLTMKRDTPYMSTLLAVKMDKPCASNWWGRREIETHCISAYPHCWWWRGLHLVHVQTAGGEKDKSSPKVGSPQISSAIATCIPSANAALCRYAICRPNLFLSCLFSSQNIV